MEFSFQTMALVLGGLAGLLILFEVLAVLLLIYRGREVISNAVRYERIVPSAERSVLFLGDSTGVGVGAASPNESIAGRIGADIADVLIENKSENGFRIADVRTTLSVLPEEAHYDLIMLMVGGNDVIRFTNLDIFRADLREALHIAGGHADTVTMMSSGNVGHAHAWPFLLGRLYDARSRAIRTIILEEVARAGIVYTDVFEDDPAQDPFVLDPSRFHARDGLHPSGEGYRVWYEQFVERWRQEGEHWLATDYRS